MFAQQNTTKPLAFNGLNRGNIPGLQMGAGEVAIQAPPLVPIRDTLRAVKIPVPMLPVPPKKHHKKQYTQAKLMPTVNYAEPRKSAVPNAVPYLPQPMSDAEFRAQFSWVSDEIWRCFEMTNMIWTEVQKQFESQSQSK